MLFANAVITDSDVNTFGELVTAGFSSFALVDRANHSVVVSRKPYYNDLITIY